MTTEPNTEDEEDIWTSSSSCDRSRAPSVEELLSRDGEFVQEAEQFMMPVRAQGITATADISRHLDSCWGRWGQGRVAHHLSGDLTDNTPANLAIITASDQQHYLTTATGELTAVLVSGAWQRLTKATINYTKAMRWHPLGNKRPRQYYGKRKHYGKR